ncbi:hypothetical protein [uncultured Ruminococcus sp.]|uniref:hypothetical protein n=1 Tax=uncultured Ruminococcus sp. TaxID=165186 RepID=UPI0025E635A6|nr:hypothetical protein [uncultured Ruminococcus sp.]
MNPMAVMKLRPLMERFHPAIPQFMHTAASGLEVDGFIGLKVTNAAGQKIEANIKLTEEDIELFNSFRELLAEANK